MQYTGATVRALGYVRVADGQGPIFRAQAAAIEEACAVRKIALVGLVSDVGPYDRPLGQRPGLQSVLDRLAAGHAGCLMVGRLDHLTRSVAELRTILTAVIERDASLLVLGTGGHPPSSGRRFGRDEPHEERIAALLGHGLDLQAIAAALGSDG